MCLGTREEGEDLISPCKCKGTQRFVYKKCLLKWQKSLLKSWSVKSMYRAKYCTVCSAPYSLNPPGYRMVSLIEILQSCVMLCFAISIAPFFSFSVAGCAFGMAGIYAIVRAPTISLALVIVGGYMLVHVGLRPAITSHNGRLRISFTRHGAAVEGIEPGILLVSKGPHSGFFALSVIFLIEHNIDGSYGLILNHPLVENATVAGVGDQHNLARFGGPVPERRVHLTQQVTDGARRAAGLDLFVGHNLPSESDVKYAAFDGSSRWGPGQLDGEVRAMSWSWLPRETIDIHEALRLGAEGRRELWDLCSEHPDLKDFGA